MGQRKDGLTYAKSASLQKINKTECPVRGKAVREWTGFEAASKTDRIGFLFLENT
jgi:hypothetical protein